MGRTPLITGSALQISESQLTASGSYPHPFHAPFMARLNSPSAWSVNSLSKEAWIQADFGKIPHHPQYFTRRLFKDMQGRRKWAGGVPRW